MMSRLRIWRVVPTSETGSQAPTFFVETQDDVLEKAERVALKMAKELSALSKFDNWTFQLTKISKRKDEFGRYFTYHQ